VIVEDPSPTTNPSGKSPGFLPHELDYTHLRMVWRRWKKANLKILSPPWIDRTLSRVFQFRGDFVLDFRLIDYPGLLGGG
jgi:hypothetical protein